MLHRVLTPILLARRFWPLLGIALVLLLGQVAMLWQNPTLRLPLGIFLAGFVVFVLLAQRQLQVQMSERNLLRTLIDSIPNGIYVLDAEARFAVANKAHTDFFSTTPAGIIGKTDLDLTPTELGGTYHADNLAVIRSGQPLVNYEEPVVNREGQRNWASTTKVPLRDSRGQIIGLVGISYDITRIKQTEEALARERNLLRTVLDNLPDVIFVHDRDGKVLLDNLADRRFIGAEDALGRTVYDHFPPELAAHYDGQNKAVIETGEPVLNDEQVGLDSSGSQRAFLVNKVPLRDAEGTIIGVVGIARDISDRKAMEEAFAKERNLLRTLIDNLPHNIYVKDTESRFLLVNATQAGFMGVSEETAIGKTDFDFFPREYAANFYTDEQQLIASGQPLINREELAQHHTGKVAWMSSTKVPLRDSQGRITGLIGVSRDITERKEMEGALAKERALLRTVIDNLPDLVFVKDREGHNILNNLADVRFVGADSAQELAGKTVFDFLPPDVSKAYHAAEQHILHTGEPQLNHEEEHTDGQGRRRWFITSKVPLRDSEGEILGLVGIARDITERKQAEEALAAERNLLRTVVDNMPDIVYVKDTACRFLMRNKTDIELLKLNSPDDLVGKTDFDLFSREVAEKTFAQEQAVMSTGQPVINLEERLIFVEQNHEERWALITKVPLRGPDGKIVGLVGINRDISERKRAEQALAKERALLQTVIDNLPDSIFVKDREGRNILVNLADARFMGIDDREELVGKSVFDIFPPEEAARYHAEEQALMQSEQSIFNQESSGHDPSGQLHWFLMTKVPLRDNQGQVIGLVGVARDITERKHIEQELAKERNLLRTVIDNLPDLIYVRDPQSRFVLVNDACLKFTGADSAEALIGRTDFDFYAPEEASRFFEAEQALMHNGQAIRNQDVLVELPKTGKQMWVSATKIPLRDSDGHLLGLVGISRDITERKQAEQALAEERNLLRTLIDNLPDYVYVKDTQSRWVLRNKTGIQEVFGLASPDDLVGKTDFDFFPRELAQSYYDEEQAIIQTGQPIVNREAYVTLANGEEGWLSYTKVPLHDTQGKIVGLVGATRDITEHKRIEEELARERNLLRTLIDNLPDYIYVKDRNSRFLLNNRTSLNAFGVASQEELAGKNDFDYYKPELAAVYYADEQAIMASGKPLANHEEPSTEVDTGRPIWLSTTKVPLRSSQGDIIGIVGVSHDITQRKSIEEELARERNLLRTVIDTLPDLIYVRNIDGRILLVNEACLQFVGLNRHEDMVGKTDFDFYDTEKATRYFAAEQAMMSSGKPIVNSEEFVTEARTGNSMWVSATKVPLRDPDGKTIGMVGVSRDITARKEAEQALAEERNLLRTVIDNIPDYIYVKGTDGKFILRNHSGIELLGLKSPEEIIGKTDFDFFPRDLAEDFHSEEQTIIQTGHAIVNQEVHVVEPIGSQRWLLYTKVPLRDSQGDIVGIVGVSRDINERKQVEDELRKLSSAVEQSSSAIMITDKEGTIEYLNPQFTRLTGYDIEESLGQKPNLWQSGEVAPEIYRNLWDRIFNDGEWRGELLNRRKSGELYWVLMTISSIRNIEGEITHFIAVQEDITERKQAEQSLKLAHDQLEYERAQLQAILDSMGEGVIYDENLQTRYINQALTRLTGYTVEEWKGYLNPLKSARMSDEELEALHQSIYDSVARLGIWRGEVELRRKDGSEFDAALTCTEVTGADALSSGTVTIIRDISVEKALQEQKSRFVANASHELRTPITNLKTRLYLLRKQPEKMDTHIQIIEDVTARMQRLVEDMLDVSRFERGQIPLHQQPVVLQNLLSSVVEIQRAEAERKGIRLTCELPSEPLHVFADPERITQVITNLVVNAINYTPEGGFVFVHAGSDSDDCAAIHVRDTGVGIASDHLQQVFQPFFRASQGVSSGTGLGLTIVKDIVELHGGSIAVESQVGHGSRFSVKLALTRN